jgi:hypothetical protein
MGAAVADTPTLLDRVREAGVVLMLDSQGVEAFALGGGRIPPALLSELRQRRAEIVELLYVRRCGRDHWNPSTAGCGRCEVEEREAA